jgi:hypothetical protein
LRACSRSPTVACSTAFEHALALLGATDGDFVFNAADAYISQFVQGHARLLGELKQRKTCWFFTAAGTAFGPDEFTVRWSEARARP